MPTVAPARLTRVDVVHFSLEVPIEDFEVLPRELGCSLLRHGDERLTLATEQIGCSLHFVIAGDVACLTRVEIDQDPKATFFTDVLALLVQLYGGDLEAELKWDRPGVYDAHLSVKAGETNHPLLFQGEGEELLEASQPDDFSMSLVERAIEESRAAWGEYVRLRLTKEKQSQSLT